MVTITPRKSKPFPAMKTRPMKAGVLDHKKAFGGPKPLPKFRNMRTVKGIKRGITAAKWFKRNF